MDDVYLYLFSLYNKYVYWGGGVWFALWVVSEGSNVYLIMSSVNNRK